MKKTGNINVNSALYWDSIYSDTKRMKEREDASVCGEKPSCMDGLHIYPSKRMTTMADLCYGDKILDIGCGMGTLMDLIQQRLPTAELWGVDISSKIIEQNKVNFPGMTFHKQYVGNLNRVPGRVFDCVVSGEVLEHLEDPELLVSDAWKALKMGGRFIVSTPLEDHIHSHEHVWYFTKDDIARMFKDNGFSDPTFVDLPDLEKMTIILAYGTKI